jgi:hypothetical protein
MTPVKHSELSDVDVWRAIQYLDPDLEAQLQQLPGDRTTTNKMEAKAPIAALIFFAVLVGAMVLGYFWLLAKL